MAKSTRRSEADLRAALTLLADRYQQAAVRVAATGSPHRATQIRMAADDIRLVLATGRLPLYLTTGTELEQYATTERAS